VRQGEGGLEITSRELGSNWDRSEISGGSSRMRSSPPPESGRTGGDGGARRAGLGCDRRARLGSGTGGLGEGTSSPQLSSDQTGLGWVGRVGVGFAIGRVPAWYTVPNFQWHLWSCAANSNYKSIFTPKPSPNHARLSVWGRVSFVGRRFPVASPKSRLKH
jgi:hypothetical protein